VSMLVDLRAVIEAALAKNARRAAAAKPVAAPKARAQAAAANADVPDFEVSSSSAEWSENAPAGQQETDGNSSK
jgi:hypothetical protein